MPLPVHKEALLSHIPDGAYAYAAFGILLILVGVQLISMGLLGEIMVRTYHESQRKPIYTIREIIGGEK